MPFESTAQQRWAFATHQPFAKRWAKLTVADGGFADLPDRVKPKKRRSQDVHIKVALASAQRRPTLHKR